MNPVDNPFSPGAGTAPAVLAGRADILAAARDAIASLVLGQAPRPILLTGHRGMGKTVLLNAFARQARGVELTVVRIEAGRGRSFEELLAAGVRLRERDGRASGLVLLIDEAQNLGTRGLEDLAAWIAARRASGSSVWAAAAGLPFESRDTKAGNEKSFMRFAVDVLTQDETRFAFEEPLRREGSSIESAALAY